MATKVLMPRIGSSVTEGTVGKWLVKEGDVVKRFQPLVEVSSEKATIEAPSPADGVILKILFPAGARLPVGETLAFIGEADEKLPET